MPWVQKVTDTNQWYNELSDDTVVRHNDGTTYAVRVESDAVRELISAAREVLTHACSIPGMMYHNSFGALNEALDKVLHAHQEG
jgi:hypothetical protein